MTLALHARYLIEDGVGFADALSWRFRGQPLVQQDSAKTSTANWTLPGIRLRGFAGLSRHKVLLSVSITSALVLPMCWAWAQWPMLAALDKRMQGITITDIGGLDGGTIARPDALTIKDGAGRSVVRQYTPVKSIPTDFLAAANQLEGEGVLGISPVNIARAIICLPLQQAGFQTFAILRLRRGRCGGGSTLAAQGIRSLTSAEAYTYGRKLQEWSNVVALNLHHRAGTNAHSRFIANNVRLGFAEGFPLIGVANTSRAVFGKTENLDLHESVLLASMLRFPIALNCGPASNTALRQFELVRTRAVIALDGRFSNDPRHAAAHEQLMKMKPITSPIPSSIAVEAGLDSVAACRAAAHPLLQFEALDSSARLAAKASLTAARIDISSVREVKLTTSFRMQAAFKAQVDGALKLIAVQQRGHWQKDPRSNQVAVLAFATDPDGNLTALYDSADAQLNVTRELGSLAKIPAALFLAEQGWTLNRLFCNHASPPFTNAGGDPGVKLCSSGRGMMSADEVWSKSVSLAVLDALRKFPADRLKARMNDMGIEIPDGLEPAYALAFGLARTSPARMSQIFASTSLQSSVAGNEPSVVASFRTSDGRTQNLSSVGANMGFAFRTPSAREFVSVAAKAALGRNGTLSALGPAMNGSVAKSGTLDGIAKQVRLKTAAGAWRGGSWFVMVVPRRGGALGDSAISIIPLAKVVRDAMMSAPKATAQSTK